MVDLAKSTAGRKGGIASAIVTAERMKRKIAEYNANAKACRNCDEPLSYEDVQRKKVFCNKSCAASYNNVKYPKRAHNRTFDCLYCGKSNPVANHINNKYCGNDCFQDSRRVIRTALVESGQASSHQCKMYLIEKHGNKCQKCGWSEINPVTGNVPVEIEHIDGNSENNNLTNLELLCPNCHSLTPTYKALNKGNGRHERRKRYAEGKSF